MSPEDQEEFDQLAPGDQYDPNARRALGLQSTKEIKSDRDVLQLYQELLRSRPEGKEMIQAFMKGSISVCHTPFYEGFAVDAEKKGEPQSISGEQTILRDWLKKYGSNSKDALSCVAFTEPIGNCPTSYFGVNIEAFEGAIGFYMKGYPILVNEHDVMSQTLGALPAGLVKHQKNSGVAKRAGISAMGNNLYGLNWDWAGEVLLDNWKPIGIYIDVGNDELDYDGWAVHDILHDAIKTGLPVYMFDRDTPLGKVTGTVEEWMDEQSGDLLTV